jgi:hypothetical protein
MLMDSVPKANLTRKPKAASGLELSGSLRQWKLCVMTEHSEIECTKEQRKIGDLMWESDLGAGCIREDVVDSLTMGRLSGRATSQEALAAQSRGHQVWVMVDEVILRELMIENLGVLFVLVAVATFLCLPLRSISRSFSENDSKVYMACPCVFLPNERDIRDESISAISSSLCYSEPQRSVPRPRPCVPFNLCSSRSHKRA